jgi:hypothetical protein
MSGRAMSATTADFRHMIDAEVVAVERFVRLLEAEQKLLIDGCGRRTARPPAREERARRPIDRASPTCATGRSPPTD